VSNVIRTVLMMWQ